MQNNIALLELEKILNEGCFVKKWNAKIIMKIKI